VIALIGNGGEIYWLLVIIRCGPQDIRGGWGYRVSRQIAVSAAMIIDGWSVLSTTDGCSNVADGAEIPEVFWIAVVLAAGRTSVL